MGRTSQALQKKLDKKVIKRLGQDVVRRRGIPSNDTSLLDRYGEPDINTPISGAYEDKTIRIVVTYVKVDEMETSIGGMSDQKKEKIRFYLSYQEDIAIGDEIFFPFEATRQYTVDVVKPNYLEDGNVIFQIEAGRQAVTK